MGPFLTTPANAESTSVVCKLFCLLFSLKSTQIWVHLRDVIKKKGKDGGEEDLMHEVRVGFRTIKICLCEFLFINPCWEVLVQDIYCGVLELLL